MTSPRSKGRLVGRAVGRAALRTIRRLALSGVALAVALLALGCPRPPAPQVVVRDEGRLGSVRLYSTPNSTRALAFLFSDAAGWSEASTASAQRLAGEGILVVGVDWPSYRQGLRASDDGCHYVIAELEDLAHRLEREHGFDHYRGPWLAGVGVGGALAYAALAQSPAATVEGAISIDPTPTLDTRVPLCPGAVAHAVAQADANGGFAYDAKPDLPGAWWVSAKTALPAPLAALARKPASPLDSAAAADMRLVELLDAATAEHADTASGLEDLPLVELPVPGPAHQLAVLFSGDGGWRDLDKDVAGVLAREGTPVVGVDSLRYFWREKPPATVARDLARILRHYEARWQTERVLLIGYSFGADVMPFVMASLPKELQAHVRQISLLGLAATTPFEISVTGWLGRDGDGRAVRPVLETLDLSRIQCFYGREETDSLCPAPGLEAMERIETSGGHHFDGDYEKLARRILDGAARRESDAPR